MSTLGYQPRLDGRRIRFRHTVYFSIAEEKACHFRYRAYSPCDVFGLKLTFALVAVTYLFARKSWSVFGTGDVMSPSPTARPAPRVLSRLDKWFAEFDLERALGLSYDMSVVCPDVEKAKPPTPLECELKQSAAWQPNTERPHKVLTMPARSEKPVSPRITPPAEKLIPLNNLVRVAEFAVIDESAGQPVGDPSVFGQESVTPVMRESVDVTPTPIPIANEYRVAASLRPVSIEDLAVTDSTGTETEFPESLPEELLGALPEESIQTPNPNIREFHLTGLARGKQIRPGEPVGAPGLFEHRARMNPAPRIVPAEMLESSGLDDVIGALFHNSPSDYRVAAYSLTSPSEDGPRRDPETGEESVPREADSPLAELTEDKKPAPDPNILELPLSRHSPEELIAGQPAGAPDVFGYQPPVPAIVTEENDKVDEEDPSAPMDFSINRISERVENILSSALARPAPAINFKDTLAELASKAKKKKRKEKPAERLPSAALEHNLSRSEDRDGGLNMAEYKVQFEIFEGPLDLLLYLVKKQEVDIYEVNLTYIAEEFIQYIEMMRKFDLEIAGEFLVMAATLMYIKSKELLPVDKQVEVDDEDDEDDPRWELIRQLVEYRKFKDAASDFKQRELAQEDIFVRNPTKPDFKVESVKLKLSVFDLLGAVDKILERIDAQEDREIFADRWTVSEKIEQIRSTIEKKDRVMFTELFEDAMSRSEVVATFLALLELTKLKMIVVEQGAEFSDIEICKAPAGHGIIREEGELPLDDACNEPVVSEYDAPTGEQE